MFSKIVFAIFLVQLCSAEQEGVQNSRQEIINIAKQYVQSRYGVSSDQYVGIGQTRYSINHLNMELVYSDNRKYILKIQLPQMVVIQVLSVQSFTNHPNQFYMIAPPLPRYMVQPSTSNKRIVNVPEMKDDQESITIKNTRDILTRQFIDNYQKKEIDKDNYSFVDRYDTNLKLMKYIYQADLTAEQQQIAEQYQYKLRKIRTFVDSTQMIRKAKTVRNINSYYKIVLVDPAKDKLNGSAVKQRINQSELNFNKQKYDRLFQYFSQYDQPKKRSYIKYGTDEVFGNQYYQKEGQKLIKLSQQHLNTLINNKWLVYVMENQQIDDNSKYISNDLDQNMDKIKIKQEVDEYSFRVGEQLIRLFKYSPIDQMDNQSETKYRIQWVIDDTNNSEKELMDCIKQIDKDLQQCE